MDLDKTFDYEGWTIKYTILEPETSQQVTLPTVVFVHGTPWSSVTFQPIAKALLARKSHRIVLYDLPGYGQSQQYKSPTPKQEGQLFEGDTSVKFQGAALAALLQHLKLDSPPSIVAHDIAGTIVLRTLLLHEGVEFRDMLLMDTNTVLPWGDGFYKLARTDAETFLKLPSKIFEAMMRAVIQSATYDSRKLGGGWEEELARPWLSATEDVEEAQTLQNSFIRQIAQANDGDVQEMLDGDLYRNVKCPVKILWGENDAWIPREKMDKLAEKLGSNLKEFVTIPEAGHLIMVDQPERVAVETVLWLSRS